jgi:hypothetical protein
MDWHRLENEVFSFDGFKKKKIVVSDTTVLVGYGLGLHVGVTVHQ